MLRCALGLMLTTLTSVSVLAGTLDDRVCKLLADQRRPPGLYIAYPQPGGGIDPKRVSGQMSYNGAARFYFASSFKFGIDVLRGEGVWLVKMQTKSKSQESADAAMVYRPPVKTRCSPESALAAFDENDRFYPLWKYNQYHNAVRGIVSDPGLHESFHFKIKDILSKEANGCTATDDWKAFQADQYLFRDSNGIPVRGKNVVISSLSPIQPAMAKTEPGSARYSGLSSEFAYDVGGGDRLACFGFTMALPTKGMATRSFLDGFGPSQLKKSEAAAQSWTPITTDLTILRFDERRQVTFQRSTVEWRQ